MSIFLSRLTLYLISGVRDRLSYGCRGALLCNDPAMKRLETTAHSSQSCHCHSQWLLCREYLYISLSQLTLRLSCRYWLGSRTFSESRQMLSFKVTLDVNTPGGSIQYYRVSWNSEATQISSKREGRERAIVCAEGDAWPIWVLKSNEAGTNVRIILDWLFCLLQHIKDDR